MPSPVRLGFRILQFVLSLVALVALATGFITLPGAIVKQDGTLLTLKTSSGSPSTTFGMFATYTSMLYGLWYLVAVELYHLAARPTALVARSIDGFFALVLLFAGFVVATTGYVTHCSEITEAISRTPRMSAAFRCGNLHAGVVFTFLAMAMFLATFVLQHRDLTSTDSSTEAHAGETIELEYHIASTPKGELSLFNASVARVPEVQV